MYIFCDYARLRHLIAIVCFVAVAIQAGCASQMVRDIGVEATPANIPAFSPRNCNVYFADVVDSRPENEQVGGNQTRSALVLPLLMLLSWYHTWAGPILTKPETFGGVELLASIRKGLQKSLEASRVCGIANSEGDADFIVQPHLKHLLGMTYQKGFLFLIMASGAVATEVNFFPLGDVVIDFKVYEAKSRSQIGSFMMNEGHIFDPTQAGSNTNFSAQGQHPRVIEFNRSSEVITAFRKMFFRFPRYLEEVLVSSDRLPPINMDYKSFLIARMDRGYEYMQMARVDFATGRVTDAGQPYRYLPVFASPDKWVVSPYQPDLLGKNEYKKLIEKLSRKYNVRWETNLTAATFYGLK